MNSSMDKAAERPVESEQVVLALDTSTAALAAAVMRGGEVLAEVQSMAERNHSVHVITHIKEMLASSGIAGEQLDALVVGSGPGSYTGMRIAVTAAKTLAWVWNKSLVGISSLEAVALGGWTSGMRQLSALEEEAGEASRKEAVLAASHWVVPIMDARRGGVYTSCFACGGNGEAWRRMDQDGVRLMADWIVEIVRAAASTAGDDHLDLGSGASQSTLPDTAGKSANNGSRAPIVWLTGDLSLHGESADEMVRLGKAAGVEVRLVPYVLEGRYLGMLGAERLQRGEVENVHSFIPNYTQLTEAEVKLKQRRQQAEGESGAEQKLAGVDGK
ncbi:tRNA (adenosine(37)-N6)-threonylcarbamoyltransferase complex dimerization subunit type 1 TsaB [Paenibacillus sp. CAU 1782]